jgi:hypothetical protein
MGICKVCGKKCLKVGTLNKIGIIKSYCCECFSKTNPNFISEYWCETCTNRLIDPFGEAKTYLSQKQLSVEIDAFKR